MLVVGFTFAMWALVVYKAGSTILNAAVISGLVPHEWMMWLADDDNYDIFRMISVIGGFGLGLPLIVYGSSIRNPTAENVLSNDPRPPILYLRSFKADSLWSDDSVERFISDVFSPIGPVVCIGKPGERFAPCRAHRLYCDDDSWRQKIDELAGKSQLIIIAVSNTEGVKWEINKALRDCRENTILIVDFRSYESIREFCHRTSGIDFPKLETIFEPDILHDLTGGLMPFVVDGARQARCPDLVLSHSDVHEKSFSMRKTRKYRIDLAASLLKARQRLRMEPKE